MLRRLASIIAIALLACSPAEPAHEVDNPLPGEPQLPASINAQVHLPGPDAERHLHALVSLDTRPWRIAGCISQEAQECPPTMRIDLDPRSRNELAEHIDALRAMHRCGPEAAYPSDRAFRLTLADTRVSYAGHLPAAIDQVAAREQGECRAGARLAWWIASHFRAATERSWHAPAHVAVNLQRDAGWLNATLDVRRAHIRGCSSQEAGACERSDSVVLDEADAEIARMIRAITDNDECPHADSDGVLRVQLGDEDQSSCGEVTTLGQWIAEHFDNQE